MLLNPLGVFIKMKCVITLLLFSVIAVMAVPVQRSGMVWYQPADYYNANRAFVMQYASQPVKAYRRSGQASASGVTAFASGKKIATNTYLKRKVQSGIMASIF